MSHKLNNISVMRKFFENQSAVFDVAPSTEAAAIYDYLRENGDPFDRSAFCHFRKKFFENSNLFDSTGAIGSNPAKLLPIEFFKTEPRLQQFWARGPQVYKTFRSSGTTAQNQSSSPFSEDGLSLYRSGALTAFFAILKKMFPQIEGTQHQPQGFSLIPEQDVWPTSSLAQMVSWIDSASSLRYVDDANFADQLSDQIAADRPVWIFGTAFHFVNLIDSGFCARLPENSLIIDTGGTKGKSRSVDRNELFGMLENAFAIPAERIISEYGMSELSAQAYDCSPKNLVDRTYEFPAWVETKILDLNNQLSDFGCGALVVYDPLRIDFPHPIRTEDIVELASNKFKIIRRSKSAPLKGCSLLAELPPNANAPTPGLQGNWTISNLPLERAENAKSICDDLLNDPTIHTAFSKEFGGSLFADFAVDDLRNALNVSCEELTESAQRAIPASALGKTWTIIAPNNHSVAAFQPILMAFIGGLRIATRLPERFTGDDSFIALLLSKLNAKLPGFSTPLSPDLEIQTAADIIDEGNLLVFGTDQTLNFFAELAPGRVSGFGDSIAISCGTFSDLTRYAAEIVRDFFSMRQSGCMSARVFYLWSRDEKDLPRSVTTLSLAAERYLNLLTVDDIAALNGESIRLKLDSSEKLIATRNQGPLIAGALETDTLSPTDFVANKAFVIPILAVEAPDEEHFVNNLKSSFLEKTTVNLITLSPERCLDSEFANSMKNGSSHLSFRRFGAAQCPKLSGIHQGRPLFSTNL